MTFIQSIVLGIVEGFTEFLPISSTGHLILTADILNITQTDFVKNFEIVIQLGAILAVVVLYFKTLISNKKIWTRIISAFIPTAIFGLILYKIIKDFLLGNTVVTLWALLVGGIILIVIELLYKEKDHHVNEIESISIKNSFIIGVFQALSIIPGVSRSAATIIGARLLGTKRKAAVEFSFLLAVPTMIAASGLDIFKSNTFSYDSSQLLLLTVGFITSFIVAILAIKFFLNLIKNHSLIAFGIYRIIIAILFWLIILR